MTTIKKWLWALVPLAIALGLLFVWVNKYSLYDWYVLQSYVPTQEVSALAANSGMNETGRKIFYSHAPTVAEKESFNSVCTHTEETIVLGCYTGFDFNKDTDIFIYNVSKPELTGIKEVTAAHEMLHAAYERLSISEKSRLDELLMTMYQKINNPRVIKLVESYQKQYPDDSSIITNELHSILGTEVRSLDADLEEYYKTYFSNRDIIVSLSEQYEGIFTKKAAEAERLSGEISLRRSELNSLRDSLSALDSTLVTMMATMKAYLAAGNTAEYNAMVPVYNTKVNQYNNDLAKINRLIDETNALISQVNENAVEQQELINSIDSTYQATQ